MAGLSSKWVVLGNTIHLQGCVAFGVKRFFKVMISFSTLLQSSVISNVEESTKHEFIEGDSLLTNVCYHEPKQSLRTLRFKPILIQKMMRTQLTLPHKLVSLS